MNVDCVDLSMRMMSFALRSFSLQAAKWARAQGECTARHRRCCGAACISNSPRVEGAHAHRNAHVLRHGCHSQMLHVTTREVGGPFGMKRDVIANGIGMSAARRGCN